MYIQFLEVNMSKTCSNEPSWRFGRILITISKFPYIFTLCVSTNIWQHKTWVIIPMCVQLESFHLHRQAKLAWSSKGCRYSLPPGGLPCTYT